MIAIVPMAGRGSRFKNQGYQTPKPFIKVLNKPMFVWAIESLFQSSISKNITQLVLVVLEEDAIQNDINSIINTYKLNAEIISLEYVTEGQLSTVLMASEFLNKQDSPLLVIPSDTIVIHHTFDIPEEAQGVISVSKQDGEHWSFAAFDDQFNVHQVAEKERISDFASTGWYYFKSSYQFLNFANTLIANKEKTKGEYYIMPLYKKYLENKLQIKVAIADDMQDLGTPQAKNAFEGSNPN